MELRDLSGEEADVWDLVRPERRSLARLKQVSMRRGAWFTGLGWKHRRFFDLVLRTVDRIRSGLLLRALAPLVRTLLVAIGGDARKGSLGLMGRGAYSMMMGVAERLVRIAEQWGNESAHQWLNQAFVRYLLVMNLPQNSNSTTLASW